MKSDLIKYAMTNLMHRKLRSFLTVLSILIGIMAIYAILSFGQGIRHYIGSMAEEMGTNKIIVQAQGNGPPGSAGVTFTADDLTFLSKQKGVALAGGVAFDSTTITIKNEKAKIAYVAGYDTGTDRKLVEETMIIKLDRGRMLKTGDIDKVVVGYNYQLKDKIFKRPLRLGDRIDLGDKKVEVVGFLKEVGNPQDDSNVFMTTDGIDWLKGAKQNYKYVILQAEQGEEPKAVADRVQEKFRKHRGESKGKETFFIQTFEDAIKTFTSVINGLNAVLFVIALISVVVAAVNIMNTMYTAVLERTKEIGVFKAIGARNSHIFMIFIIESGFLGLLGGVIGVGLGYLIASAGGAAAAASGYALLKPYFPWWLTFGCLAFSFIVGAASGFSPALQASRQKPVDALRYE